MEILKNQEQYGRFLKFMTDYADYFERVMKREEEKFLALYSRDAKRMDAAFNLHIDTEEEISQLETDRLELNKNLGFEDMTFRQIIDALPPDENAKKHELQKVLDRLTFTVEQTKQFNKKSLEFAQMNLDLVAKINGAFIDAPSYTADGTQINSVTRPSIINKKA